MKYCEKFKFLNMQLNKRKNDDQKYYLVVNLLDNENNPCKFFCFNDSAISTITSRTINGLQDVTVDFDLTYSQNSWNVRLNDLIPIVNK